MTKRSIASVIVLFFEKKKKKKKTEIISNTLICWRFLTRVNVVFKIEKICLTEPPGNELYTKVAY